MKLHTAIVLTLLSTAAPAFADWPSRVWPNTDNLGPAKERERLLHDNRTTSTVVIGPRGDMHTCSTHYVGGHPAIVDCQ